MKEKITDTSKKRLLLFASMLVIGAIAILIYSALTGNGTQTFTDVVIEYTAMDGSNKSAERNLFYLFSIAGAVIYLAVFLMSKWGKVKDEPKETSVASFLATGLGITVAVNYIIYQNVNWIALSALLFLIVVYFKDKTLATEALAFYFIAVYAICGAFRAYAAFKSDLSINVIYVSVTALVLSDVLLLMNGGKKHYLRGILVSQVLVPFTLLIYVASNYLYNGQVMKVHIPARVQLVIYAIILAFIAEAALKIKRNWNEPQSLDKVLSFGTCVSIMAFNRFSGYGSIVDSDLHHPFENIIGFSQMFELGQKAFSEYIPVSGMYSLVQGLFFKVFGHGFAGFYSLAANMFYLAVSIVIVYLLRRQLEAKWVLLVTLVFMVTDYNRVALFVPIILLLAWPKLIAKKNLWLKAWFLTSFVHALYYPVFGAAVCFAFAPLGIWQIITYAKSGELLNDVKTVKFWGWWIVCFIPVLLGSGWLLGTVKHMLAMGSQTIYADGIARFAQNVPENFLAYVSNMPFRLGVYYLFSYLVLISIIWLSVALFLQSKNHENKEIPLLSLSIGIMLLVTFSYSVVRFDYNDLYSRSDGIIRAAFIVLILLMARYFHNKNNNALWIFAFAIFFTSIITGGQFVISAEGYLGIDKCEKLEACYTVPEGHVYVAHNEPRLGECFLAADSYEYIMHINNYINTLDKNQSYLGIVDSFGLFYLNDIKGDSAMEILNTIKGYGAAEETVENIRKNDTIVGMNISPLRNYYFYHWLVTSGDYIFDNDVRLFLPNDGSISREEILAQNKNINLNLSTEADDVGDVAGAFGKSMDSLEPIFTQKDIAYDLSGGDASIHVDFAKEFDGDEADFMYIEFEDVPQTYDYAIYQNHDPIIQNQYNNSIGRFLMKRIYNDGMDVTVSWTNEAGEVISSTASIDQGKLLMPLGAARGWLLNTHSQLVITASQDETAISVPKIKEIRMLKLREVK